jgi:hypothetical protein
MQLMAVMRGVLLLLLLLPALPTLHNNLWSPISGGGESQVMVSTLRLDSSNTSRHQTSPENRSIGANTKRKTQCHASLNETTSTKSQAPNP